MADWFHNRLNRAHPTNLLLMSYKAAIAIGTLALTANDEVNYLFLQKVKEETKAIVLWAALKSDSASLTVKMLHKSHAELVFGATVDVNAWDRRFKAKQVHLQQWRFDADAPKDTDDGPMMVRYAGSGLIAAAVRKNKRLAPIGDGTRFKNEDEVFFFVFEAEAEAKIEYQNQLDDLRSKRDDVRDKLSAIQQAGEGAWEDIKEGLENSWEILKMSFNKAKAEFEKGYRNGTKE